MEVAHLRWPAEHRLRESLRHQRRPRLLLVEDGAAPPQPNDCLEDWIRVPADDVDVKARTEGLAARIRRHRAGPSQPPVPRLEDGVLRVGQAWVSLSPLEADLAAALLCRMGTVVSRDALARAGWPEGASGRNSLDVHVVRLRRRMATVGLVIHTVRSRGYLVELSGSCQEGVHHP